MSIMPIQPSSWSSAVNPTGSFRCVANHAVEQHRQLHSLTISGFCWQPTRAYTQQPETITKQLQGIICHPLPYPGCMGIVEGSKAKRSLNFRTPYKATTRPVPGV
jgi:hypothetical protein